MSRVTVETRKAYVIVIGGKKRRFWTEAAAYYALAKSLLGPKYMGPLRMYEGPGYGGAEHELGISPELAKERAERAVQMFYKDDRYDGPEYFCTELWQRYVRRVANKMRALDQYAARRAV